MITQDRDNPLPHGEVYRGPTYGPFVRSNPSIPRSFVILAALVIQIAIALALVAVPALSVLHVMAIISVSLWGVITRKPELFILSVAYLTGSEVMWRQVSAPVFYLTAPYLLTAISLMALVLIVGRVGRVATLAALYFALLIPSITVTARLSGGGAREVIAFALAGPLALASLTMVTSRLRTTLPEYRAVLWMLVVSSVGPLTIAIRAVTQELAREGSIDFSTQSNVVTSGGFGPVQVSSALGLGLMAAILLILVERGAVPRLIASVAALVLAVQTLLTFSRGGSYAAVIGLGCLAISQASNKRIRQRVIVVSVVSVVLAVAVIIPRLDSFTRGAFGERFSDTDSGRTELAVNDIEIFRRNLVFGAGPGMTKYERLTFEICELRTDRCSRESSSHTEFTRMLGEHGLAGALSVLVLLAMAVEALRWGVAARPLTAAWLGWAIAQMFYANLRIVAVPVAFALAFLQVSQPDDPEGADELSDGVATLDPVPPAPILSPNNAIEPPEVDL